MTLSFTILQLLMNRLNKREVEKKKLQNYENFENLLFGFFHTYTYKTT